MPKLVKVEVAFTYYAMLEDECKIEGAADFARDAAHDVCLTEHCDCELVDCSKEVRLDDGWDENCLVYHAGMNDIKIKDLIAKIKGGDHV